MVKLLCGFQGLDVLFCFQTDLFSKSITGLPFRCNVICRSPFATMTRSHQKITLFFDAFGKQGLNMLPSDLIDIRRTCLKQVHLHWMHLLLKSQSKEVAVKWSEVMKEVCYIPGETTRYPWPKQEQREATAKHFLIKSHMSTELSLPGSCVRGAVLHSEAVGVIGYCKTNTAVRPGEMSVSRSFRDWSSLL